MKTRIFQLLISMALLAGLHQAAAQGTAFTYQGRLNDGSSPANGSYDLTFILYGVSSGGTAVAAPLINSAIAVTNGLFTTTLDFGANFPGANRWLEIAVRTNGSTPFVTLASRQPLTPVPYAITAGNVTGPVPAAQLSGTLPSADLTGTYSGTVNLSNSGNSFTGNGSGLNNVNAGLLSGLSASQFWKLAGNGGTTAGVNFVGTTDSQPLELKANSQRTLRMEPSLLTGAPNFIAGSYVNYVMPGKVGAVIGGGGATNYVQSEPALGGYYGVSSNLVFSDFGTIGGGGNNLIQSNSTLAAIGGGAFNTIQTNSRNSTIGGGLFNTIQTNGAFSAIGGGLANSVSGAGDFIGGGGYDSLAGYAGNGILADASVIGGGWGNQIYFGPDFSVIGGGVANTIGIGGSIYVVNAFGCTIGGGELNTNLGEFATIPGGYRNYAAGYADFAAGQGAKAMHDGAFVWADDSSTAPFASTGTNQFLIRATGGVGIGTTSPGSLLDVNGQVTIEGHNTSGLLFYDPGIYDMRWYGEKTASGYTMTLLDDTTGARQNWVTVDNNGNVGIGTSSSGYKLQVNGSVAGVGAYNNISDVRYKTNISTLSDALDKIMALRGVQYDWRTNEFPQINFDQGPQLGLIAQEVKEVLPEVVSRDSQGYYSIAYSKIIPVLVEAVKAQQKESEKKDTQIQDLKQTVDELKKMVQSLAEKK